MTNNFTRCPHHKPVELGYVAWHYCAKQMTDNELIAEFYNGITFDEDGFCTDKSQMYSWRPAVYDPLEVRHLAYHNNWSWLMPVVEKIEELQYEVEIAGSGTQISSTAYSELDHYDEFTTYESKEETKIQIVYKAIVKFVKWHNSQNK